MDAVYLGSPTPLTAKAIADPTGWTLDRILTGVGRTSPTAIPASTPLPKVVAHREPQKVCVFSTTIKHSKVQKPKPSAQPVPCETVTSGAVAVAP